MNCQIVSKKLVSVWSMKFTIIVGMQVPARSGLFHWQFVISIYHQTGIYQPSISLPSSLICEKIKWFKYDPCSRRMFLTIA